MKLNIWTCIGALWGAVAALLLSTPVFGMTFGLLYWYGNAVLSAVLKITDEPILIEFIYTATVITGLFAIACVLAGFYLGSRFGNGFAISPLKQRSKLVFAVSVGAIVLIFGVYIFSATKQNQKSAEREQLNEQKEQLVQSYQKITSITVDQAVEADVYVMTVLSDGDHAGPYSVKITIQDDTYNQILYENVTTADLLRGENIHSFQIPIQPLIEAYHRDIMGNTKQPYGIANHELDIQVELRPVTDESFKPLVAKSVMTLSFKKNINQ